MREYRSRWTNRVPTRVFPAIIVLLAVVSYSPPLLLAHDLLFAENPRAPGKGSLDYHASFHQDGHGDHTEREINAEFAVGLTPRLSARLSWPYQGISDHTALAHVTKSGFGDPRLRAKWRLVDGGPVDNAFALAVTLRSSIPTGGKIGRKSPSLASGLALYRRRSGRSFSAALLYQFAVKEPDASKPGDEFQVNFALGLHPPPFESRRSATAFFLGANFLHEQRARLTGGAGNPESGGDFLFFSPEARRAFGENFILRAGLQIPAAQAINGRGPRRKPTGVLQGEFRFGKND